MARTSLPGRETVVRRLDESLMAASAGRGSVTLVEGAAGLGKSRLLREAAMRARGAGLVVAEGRAEEVRRLSPLSPLLEAMQGIMPSIPGGLELNAPRARGRGQPRLLERLTKHLQARAHGEPILVALDDLQWADAETPFALQSMTELMAASPVMWLLTRRPWPSTPRLDRVIAGLVAGGATSIRLTPLSPGSVAAMAAGLLGAAPDRALLGLLEKCAGNPLMVVGLLRTLQEHDELMVDTAYATLLPGGPSGPLYQRITRELTSLSPLTRQLLEVASVFGQSFDVRCVAQVLRLSVADILPSIHEVLASELVVDEGADLGFRYDLIREAVYSALPITSLRTLHREAADALLAVGGSTDAAAAHVVKGTDVGDAHSVAILIRASDEAASTAPGNAADLRLQAVDLIPHTDADRPQRVAETIGLLYRAGRGDEGWPLAEAALQTELPNDVQAQMHFEAAEALAVGGHSAAALAHTRTALELDGVEDSTRGLLLAAEAGAHLAAGDPRAALRAGEKAVSLGRRLGTDACVGRALVTMGAAEGMRGRLSRSLRLIEQAAELVSSDSSESRHIEQQWTRGCILIALDRFDEASAVFEAAQQWANRYSNQGTAVFGRLCRSQLQLHKGALDDALAEAEAGLVRAGELESWTHVPELLAVLAEVGAYREQPELAKRHVLRGIGLVGPGTRFTAQPLAWASAVIDEAATNDCSDSSAVLAPLAATLERWPDHRFALAFNPVIAPRLVALALKVKDEKLASAAAEAAESLSRDNPGIASLAAAGMQARGVLENDAECLVAAVREFEASPRPLARARACVDAARVLSQQHRSAQAAEHLQTALAEYESVGAASPARRVRERLSGQAARGKDRKAAHRPAFGWGSLTEAELRVARLVARALTNRVIADELDLSPHTVESHLRHAFRKLDIGSRIELTRVVLRQEAALESDRRLDGHP